jgi:hypothetical protein
VGCGCNGMRFRGRRAPRLELMWELYFVVGLEGPCREFA